MSSLCVVVDIESNLKMDQFTVNDLQAAEYLLEMENNMVKINCAVCHRIRVVAKFVSWVNHNIVYRVCPGECAAKLREVVNSYQQRSNERENKENPCKKRKTRDYDRIRLENPSLWKDYSF